MATAGHGLSQKTRYATAVANKFSKCSNAVIPACSAYLNHRTEYDHGGDVKVVVWFTEVVIHMTRWLVLNIDTNFTQVQVLSAQTCILRRGGATRKSETRQQSYC